MNQLFNSVYMANEANAKPEMLMMSLLVALLTGLWLAWVYKYKTLYTKDFVITLALLPTIIAMIIFLVNGNLGTSVAVAGTFSLIRFRSAAGGAKEMLVIFMATAIGLACGMGYIFLTLGFTLVLTCLLLILEHVNFANTSQSRRYLTVKISADQDYDLLFEGIFEALCQSVELAAISFEEGDSLLKLDYIVDLKREVSDHAFINQFQAYNTLAKVSLSKVAKKKKTL